MKSLLVRGSFGLGLVLALCSGCAHLPQYAVPYPSPSPTSTPTAGPSPSPAPCGTPAAATTAFVVISVTVLPTTAPGYGAINGYVEAASDGTFGLTAQVLSLHTSDIVQFVNVDDYGGASVIYHSAVNFPGATAFPTPPYSFAPADQQAQGTVISSAPWSTGLLGAPGVVCYSQPFSLTTGTYYFGDYDFYNSLDSLRDVMTVQAGTASLRRPARPIILR